MRILIYLLVVVNLLFAGINYFVLEPKHKNSLSSPLESRSKVEHSLKLLSEIERDELIADVVNLQNQNIEPEEKQLTECLKVVGDWDMKGLSHIKELLTKDGWPILVEGKERRKKVNYWVLIPPFPTKQEAITAKRQLQGVKIVDTFIIKSGVRANALSLGLYSKQDGAKRRASYVNSKKLGIAKASIEELTLYVDRYWLKIETNSRETEVITSLIGDGILDTKLEQCEIER